MIPASWSDNPQLVLERRVRSLLIGDVTYFGRVRIRRTDRYTYYLRRGLWREKVSGIDAVNRTIDVAGLMANTDQEKT